MVDSIDSEDVERIDRIVDPTDLNAQQVEDQLQSETKPNGQPAFQGEAAEAFAQRISQAREPVRQAASEQLVDQISEPGANNRRQLYGPDPSSGRNTFVGTAQNVEVEVQPNGEVHGVNVNTGTRAVVGEVDLSARNL